MNVFLTRNSLALSISHSVVFTLSISTPSSTTFTIIIITAMMHSNTTNVNIMHELQTNS